MGISRAHYDTALWHFLIHLGCTERLHGMDSNSNETQEYVRVFLYHNNVHPLASLVQEPLSSARNLRVANGTTTDAFKILVVALDDRALLAG